MRPVKEKISITVDKDLLKRARELADKEDRSLSQFLNLALRYYITETKAQE